MATGSIIGSPTGATTIDNYNSFGDYAGYINGYTWEGWGTNLNAGTAASIGAAPGSNTGPPTPAAFLSSGGIGPITTTTPGVVVQNFSHNGSATSVLTPVDYLAYQGLNVSSLASLEPNTVIGIGTAGALENHELHNHIGLGQ